MASPPAELAILVPVLRRPQRVAPLIEAITATTGVVHRVLFLPDPSDRGEREAITRAGAKQLPVAGGYAHKINAGVRATKEPLLFLAADDIEPEPDWYEQARALLTPPVGVVGVNDLIPRRRAHATHFLVTREYALEPTIDGQAGPLSTAYAHNFVDDELIATAQVRSAYAYAPNARVKHLHPMAGRPDDSTYRRGRRSFRRDRAIFRERMQQWT